MPLLRYPSQRVVKSGTSALDETSASTNLLSFHLFINFGIFVLFQSGRQSPTIGQTQNQINRYSSTPLFHIRWALLGQSNPLFAEYFLFASLGTLGCSFMIHLKPNQIWGSVHHGFSSIYLDISQYSLNADVSLL